jgi:hypothetical protein
MVGEAFQKPFSGYRHPTGELERLRTNKNAARKERRFV